MDAQVLYASGHQPLEEQLAASIQRSSTVHVAVAFLSRFGVDFIRRNICKPGRAQWLLVTSVRWPTDLDALSKLAEEHPNKIWLHLGGKTPEEKKAEKYQLHSKLVLCTDSTGTADVYIGSHNWTGMALQGLNLEISVRIRCLANEEAARNAFGHWQECQTDSELFDPSKLAFYKEIQARLHHNVVSVNADFPNFEADRRLLILAEVQDPLIAQQSLLRLTFSPVGLGVGSQIQLGLPVDLYLYPEGCLFTSDPPPVDVIRYEGQVVMVNNNNDAPVEQRAVNTEIADLNRPKVTWLDSMDNSRRNRQQVIASLKRGATHSMPIFHKGDSPKVRHVVEFERHMPEWIYYHPQVEYQHYLTNESLDQGHLVLNVPSGMREEVELNIPQSELYDPAPLDQLEERFKENHPTGTQRRRYILKQKTSKQITWETPYFFLVTHREKSHS